MLVILAGVAVLLLAGSFELILIRGALVGLGVGADLPVSLATISEASTEENRGKLLGFSNLLWIAGAVVAGILVGGVANLGESGARILYIHLGVVSALLLVGRLTIPESEDWRLAAAERRAGAATIRADRALTRELFRAPYAVPFFALIGFYSLTNLAANTTGSFGSFILVNYGGIELGSAAILGVAFVPLAVVAYLWFMRIADKPVRFRYFTVGAAASVIGLLVNAIFGINLVTAIVAGMLSIVGSAFAFEGIMKVWTQQSFPTLLRTTAQGAVLAVARFSSAALAAVTPLLLHALGARAFYGMLALLVFVGVAWAWVVFRTRDQHDEFETEAEPDIEPINAGHKG